MVFCGSPGISGGIVPDAGAGAGVVGNTGVAPGSGLAEPCERSLPQDVQNFVPSAFRFKQWGHCCVKEISPLSNLLCSFYYKLVPNIWQRPFIPQPGSWKKIILKYTSR
jgi:hypothetical protein